MDVDPLDAEMVEYINQYVDTNRKGKDADIHIRSWNIVARQHLIMGGNGERNTESGAEIAEESIQDTAIP